MYKLNKIEDRIGDYDPSGNIITAYTHGPGIDEPVAMTLNNSTHFYIPDIQGSIRAIVDTQGNAVATYQYDAWGNLVSYGGPMAQENDYLYTGREYDWQTGIYYYRARYYNPELGRFLSRDPAGMVDGPNMYVYVKNEPVNKVDPWGKDVVLLDKLPPGYICCGGIKSGVWVDRGKYERCAGQDFFDIVVAAGLVITSIFIGGVGWIAVGVSLYLLYRQYNSFSSKERECMKKYAKDVMLCYNPCWGVGGGPGVPGPRPPIVGPLPTHFRAIGVR